ncbi:MAG: peroxiredoxin [Myxococcota bacterium]|nr:peroxiredoxin [Myxococcota bacterium]
MIAVGEMLYAGTVQSMAADGPKLIELPAYILDKKVVLFGVMGAFTPGCTRNHLGGYIERSAEITANGFDEILCISANDVYVMDAWGQSVGATGKVTLLADGNAAYLTRLGLSVDLAEHGLGTRGRRFALTAVNGVVQALYLDGHYIETTGASHVCSLES